MTFRAALRALHRSRLGQKIRESEGQLRSAWRSCVLAAVGFHLGAVLWFLIPETGYPVGPATFLPPWLTSSEDALFAWKKRHHASFLSQAFTRWIFLSETRQNWWMFAPRPDNRGRWLTVKAVAEWRPLDRPAPGKARPWGRMKEPIYEAAPLYVSYPEHLATHYTREKGYEGRSDPSMKFATSLASADQEVLQSFTEYWVRTYARAHGGKKPLAVHVLVTTGHDAPKSDATDLETLDPAARVISYYDPQQGAEKASEGPSEDSP